MRGPNRRRTQPMQTRTTKRPTRAALLCAVVMLGVFGTHTAADAQVYQPYWTARPVVDDSPALGGAVGFGDSMFRFAGHARFSITSASDLGLELVFDNFEDDVGDDTHLFGGGLDYKYLVVADGARLPFDLAAQACVGMEWGDGLSLLTVPFGFLGSKSILLADDGREITPFGGAYVVIEHTSVDGPGDNDDTDVSAEIRLGTAFQIAGQKRAYAALHLGNGTMFFLGFSVGL